MQRPTTMISRIGAMLTLALCVAAPAAAQDKPVTESQLDAAIQSYIMRNPQVIREALAKASLAEEVERTKHILREQSDAMYRSGSPTIGAADAKITIVAFFDYNCPHCRKSYPTLRQLLEKNPDIRLVLKDIANLGKESEAVARLAIAAQRQNQFQPLHDALMDRQGRTTEAVALDVARKLGIDIDLLKKTAAAQETTRTLDATRALATSLSVEGTPLFIIGHNGIAGAPDDLTAQLAKFVAEARQSGCDVCGPRE
jgi:protein-disulfide isomerase